MARTLLPLPEYVKEHLSVIAAVVAVLAVFTLTVWIGAQFFEWLGGPTSDEAGVVTVLEPVAGRSRRSYRHRVPTVSGAEYVLSFGELYRPDTRLWVNYRRFVHGGTIKVTFYRIVPD